MQQTNLLERPKQTPNSHSGAIQDSSDRRISDDFDQDRKLVRRIRGGDGAAAEELVKQHGGRMLAVARRMMSQEQDALDAVQDAFASAFLHLQDFTGGSRLLTWLHRITVNACLMKLRRVARRPGSLSIEDLGPKFDPTGHHGQAPKKWTADGLNRLAKEELQQEVRQCIDRLPNDYREILILRDIEELSTQETARSLRISKGLVKTRLHRARQALRELLEPIVCD